MINQKKLLEIVPGLKREDFQNWMKRGLLDLEACAQSGGKNRLYSAEDVLRVMVFNQLSKLGLKPSGVSDALALVAEVAVMKFWSTNPYGQPEVELVNGVSCRRHTVQVDELPLIILFTGADGGMSFATTDSFDVGKLDQMESYITINLKPLIKRLQMVVG